MLTSHAMIVHVYLTIKTYNFVVSNKFPEFDHFDPGLRIKLCLFLCSSFVTAFMVTPHKQKFVVWHITQGDTKTPSAESLMILSLGDVISKIPNNTTTGFLLTNEECL